LQKGSAARQDGSFQSILEGLQREDGNIALVGNLNIILVLMPDAEAITPVQPLKIEHRIMQRVKNHLLATNSPKHSGGFCACRIS
jgi:hypothetical protein